MAEKGLTRIVVLGATGSIGTQTLAIAAEHPERLQVVGIMANQSEQALNDLGDQYGVTKRVLLQRDGMDAVLDLVTGEDVDRVVVAVAGVIGLKPTLAAIEAGKDIALASKEVLVAAGEWVMPLVARHGVLMTPIDSEHSAIFQCMQGYHPDQVSHLTLTASGGPFRGWSRSQLAQVTVDQALNHPTWRMGGKITIDSATLFNKALEMIEARWLFGLGMEQVRVVVHPQSVVHSLVTFRDGSALGQLGWPDMRLPIQYALLYPDRVPNSLKPWDPTLTPNLTFEPVNEGAFTALGLAREAARQGGTMPCVFNAANEAAVAAFLAGKLGFLEIADRVERAMARHTPLPVNLESLLAADAWAREQISV